MNSLRQYLVVISVLFFFSGVSWAAKNCYQCKTGDYGCDNPNVYNATNNITCDNLKPGVLHTYPFGEIMYELKQRTRFNTTAYSYLCATILINNEDYANYSGSSGTYRTCILNSTTNGEQDCKILKGDLKFRGFGNIVKCRTCSDDNCNNITANVFSASPEMKLASVLFYTFFGFLFVLRIL
ncbi:hypothetical protein HHI36_014253 [Cryptolaemus montrouzieri]|uniref:Protein sleepless n=1 Tax=Cryptolaemus montrouzieri TaxID=559131 RepID=A0ABD2N1Y7_9CUCU